MTHEEELYQERAALMEYLGSLPRPEAERLARLDIAKQFHPQMELEERG